MSASKPWTLKRLAWAYGCAQKGSTEEASLRDELERRIREPVVVHLRLRGRQLIDSGPEGGAGHHRGAVLMDEAARIEAGGRLHEEATT